jgi:hypothetical protein
LLAACAIGPARADPCVINGTTATCSGDQSSGIQIDTGSGLTSLFVQSVTTNIGPPNGISFKSEGADGGNNGSGADATNLSVTTDGTVVIHATGAASGIYVSSTGGNSFDVSQGHGGIAGDVTVSNAGVGTTTGINAYGILARSIGGNGRPNNQDDGALGAPGGIVTVTNAGTASITTTSDGAAGIYAFSSSGHTTNSSTYGIGVGTVTVTNNGSIETSGTSGLTDPLSFAHGIVAVNIAGSGSDGKTRTASPAPAAAMPAWAGTPVWSRSRRLTASRRTATAAMASTHRARVASAAPVVRPASEVRRMPVVVMVPRVVLAVS